MTEAMKLLSSANERLRRIDAEKDDFLNQVSHELRTPMTSIRSFSEILLGADDVSAQEREKFLNIIHDESQRLTRLLDEILDINTLQHDSKGISLATVSATAAIDAALASVDSLLREKRVRIELENAHREIAVLANSDRLRQVLINLLSNAVKYNDSAEPQITIRTLRNRDQFYIDVMDNGGGVDAKEALTVFEKFQRGNRSNRGHGAGLGLPISRSIMRNMGGDLTIEFSQRNMSYFRMHLQVATPQGT